MNRPIKFRLWIGANNTMGPTIELKPGTQTFIREGDVLMQFTGLTDKNGKEIYEGDVLQCYDTEGGEVYKHKVELPHFYRECWSNNEQNLPADPEEVCAFVEVIGNVWENPELTK